MQVNIKEIVRSITNISITDESIEEKIAIVLDVSGSTGTKFNNSMNVLEKEMSVLMEYILKNPDNKYVLYTFDSTQKYHGQIAIMKSEGFVNLPDLHPGSATFTHYPLVDIVSKLGIFKPNKVVIFTDGQTNSRVSDFIPIIKEFKIFKVKLEIIAVSATNYNMDTITSREESTIPGMDLINMIGNTINGLTIYNQYHSDVPYIGAQSSEVDKNSLMFLGIPISGIIPQFIDRLLTTVEEKKDLIDWGINQMDLKKFISEIGKFMSIIFVSFPLEHTFTTMITRRISLISSLEPDRILGILQYGFDCTKQNKPVVYTNFEGHVKEATIKKNEFADAVSLLNTKGTCLGSTKRISCPSNGVCVIDNNCINITNPLGSYPNSRDKYNNTYFAIDGVGQAIRIGMRGLCGEIGLRDARNSPSVIFHILNQMSLMFIKGINLNCEHMDELRKLAIQQTSMEVIVAQGIYDGVGCYTQWKAGNLIKMHFKNPLTHTSLYTDISINPLKLTEPIWWALMMSMLGIFKEQLYNYESALKVLLRDDEITEENFLSYIKIKYNSIIKGNVILQKYDQPKISVISLDHFNPSDTIFMFKNHGDCKAETWYSEMEFNSYVKTHGCVWCRFIPTDEYIESIVLEDNEKKLEDVMKECSLLYIEDLNRFSTGCGSIYSGAGSASCTDIPYVSTSSSGNRNVRINLMGITGSGKSTTALLMSDYLISKGLKVLIVSADKWSKRGISGKDVANKVFGEILHFDKEQCDKVIIVDICNEGGINNKCFNYDLSSYETYNYTPNFNKDKANFNDYECWCLSNVLDRTMHNEHTNYWLNPESAGVSVCIKVHNMKAKGIKNILKIKSNPKSFDERLTVEQINNLIKDGKEKYDIIIKSKDLKIVVAEFLTSIKL